MNVERIRQLQEFLRKKALRFNQNIVFRGKVNPGGDSVCGTMGCIAGHAVAMSRGNRFEKQETSRVRFEETGNEVIPNQIDVQFIAEAAAILGLDSIQVNDLFRADKSNRDATREEAIQALQNLLDYPDEDPWEFKVAELEGVRT